MDEVKPYQKVLTLNKSDYLEVHVNLINSITRLKLTPKEIEVLIGFLELEGDIAKDRFCTLGRKLVKDKLGISSSGLSNYLSTLSEKKCIVEVDNHIEIHRIFHPKANEQTYQFKLICNGER